MKKRILTRTAKMGTKLLLSLLVLLLALTGCNAPNTPMDTTPEETPEVTPEETTQVTPEDTTSPEEDTTGETETEETTTGENESEPAIDPRKDQTHPLSQDIETQIIEDYIAQYQITTSKDELFVRCFGCFGNSYAVIVEDAFPYFKSPTCETVGEYVIEYLTGNKIYLYENGTLYSVSDSYDTGRISLAELQELIANYYSIRGPYKKLKAHLVTTDMAYRENHVLVLMMPFANQVTYTVDDFADIDCISVQDFGYNGNKLSRSLCLTIAEPSKENVIEAMRIIEQRFDVYCAEPNLILSWDSAVSSDSNTELVTEWAPEKIQLEEAWGITTGSSSVYVGVIDSGVDKDHPRLENRVNQVLSKNLYDEDASALLDTAGHGTMIAGIIGAYSANSSLVNGVCRQVQIVSLKVADDQGQPDVLSIKNALTYAENNGIKIVNCSANRYKNSVQTEAAEQLMEMWENAIRNYPGLYVGSAGNWGMDSSTATYTVYPRISNIPNAISVGASTEADLREIDSSFGETTVDLFAPGSQILGCYPTTLCDGHLCSIEGHQLLNFHVASGTSFAAPYVTGVAALMLSYNPYLTPAQIKQIIMSNVDIIYDEDGNSVFGELCVSGGRLNAYKAVRAAYHTHDEYWDVCAEWHNYTCVTCDCVGIEESHEYVRYARNPGANSGTTHRKYCHCGYYVVEDHVVRATNDGSATFPAQCMICGLVATGGSVAIVSIPITPEIMTMGTYTFSDGTTVRILTENGSYVLPNGVIVLVDEDADLVEAGLLDPYALVENLPTPSNPGHVTE